jgi:DNA-3-methyladenine glycosylase
VARDLIRKTLVRNLGNGTVLRGKIVETEAYGGLKDPASHAFRGPTPRNEIMFGDPGFTYVYFTYGFHHCLNVVTGIKGKAEAVLLRALEPTDGLEIMMKNRGDGIGRANLTSGPGKICQALAIDRTLSKLDVTKRSSPICFENSQTNSTESKIAKSSRIGITAGVEKLWRFYDPSSRCVSHRSKLNLSRK